jgi:hypothetical protein
MKEQQEQNLVKLDLKIARNHQYYHIEFLARYQYKFTVFNFCCDTKQEYIVELINQMNNCHLILNKSK